MSKATKTKKKKRVYRCSYCGELGHNARTCPKRKADEAAAKAAAEAAETGATAPIEELIDPEPVAEVQKPEPPPVSESPKVALNETVDILHGHRKKNTRPVAPAAPYECPSCLKVGILCLVELPGGSKALRCEHCQNSSPITKILKWGAFPSDKPKRQP